MALEIWRLNLKVCRKNLDKNQSYIASVIGKTQQTIGNWESGIGEPNIMELIKITNLFGILIDDFLKIKQSKSTSGHSNVLEEPSVDYGVTNNMVETLSLAIRGFDAANTLLQNKITVLEKENMRLKKRVKL
jgi:DNA-binding XRE family transcriptional regulator